MEILYISKEIYLKKLVHGIVWAVRASWKCVRQAGRLRFCCDVEVLNPNLVGKVSRLEVQAGGKGVV